MNIADLARSSALQVEAKKHALRQQQDGCWIMTLRVHQNDMPEQVMKAAMGTRYVLAMVEIGDDEQPLPPHPAVAAPRPAEATPLKSAGENKQKRSFEEIPAPQQAGMLCNDEAFQKFLSETYHRWWENGLSRDWSPHDTARQIICTLCKVSSRKDLTPSNTEWHTLVLNFRAWQRHPELTPA